MPRKNQSDSVEYTKILKDHVIDLLNMHEPFQQDNAPAHTSVKTKNCFGKMGSLYWKIGLHSPLVSTLLKICGMS